MRPRSGAPLAARDPMSMRVWGVLALVLLLTGACARKPVVQPQSTGAAPPASAPAVSTPPGGPAAPFTNRELIDELRKQGVDRPPPSGSASGPSGAMGQGAGQPLPEIRETPQGVVITLPMAHFAFDSAQLDAEARRIVERIALVLNNPRAADRKVVLEGHAGAMGTQAYTLALSRRRAETVTRGLIAQGVHRDRVSIEAYGESRPIAPNQNSDGTDNPAGRAQNRRVEAVIRN